MLSFNAEKKIKNETVSTTETYMDLSVIILSDVSQNNNYHLSVESEN